MMEENGNGNINYYNNKMIQYDNKIKKQTSRKMVIRKFLSLYLSISFSLLFFSVSFSLSLSLSLFVSLSDAPSISISLSLYTCFSLRHLPT